MKYFAHVLVAVLVPLLARAQTPNDWSPPPLVPADAPPPPPPIQPGTPAPPGPVSPGTPMPPSVQPGAQPYMPYGPAPVKEPPAPEVGLMVSESLFGMLTAAGILVLPFFLFGFAGGGGLLSGDPVVGTVLAALLFGTAPLAVAQTQVSIANGSRYYYSEMWPAALAGLGAQAAVLGLTYLTGGGAIVRNSNTCPGGPPAGGGSVPAGCGNDVLLLVGSIVAVPLIQMAVLNLTKGPRMRGALASRDEKTGALALGIPTPSPVLGRTSAGMSMGVNVSLIDFRF